MTFAFLIFSLLVIGMPVIRAGIPLWSVSLMQALLCLALILLVISGRQRGKNYLQGAPFTRPILCLAALATVSWLFSRHGPAATEGLVLLFSYIGFYYLSYAMTRTRAGQRQIVHLLIGLAVVLSLIGLLKRFGMSPFGLWEYSDIVVSSGFLSSTYGNHNHFAGFLEMVMPFAAVLLVTRHRSTGMRLLLIYLLVFLLCIQALTLSRGGWVSSFISLSFLLVMLSFQQGAFQKRFFVMIAACIVVITFFSVASTPFVDRVVTLTERDPSANLEGRIRIWGATLDLIQDNPVTGTGPGTFATVFPKYQPPHKAVTFKRAHNDYLQSISDVGILAVPIFLWFLWIFFKIAWTNTKSQSRQTRGINLAAMAAMIAIMVHSLVDFNFHIPANVLIFIVICSLVRMDIINDKTERKTVQ